MPDAKKAKGVVVKNGDKPKAPVEEEEEYNEEDDEEEEEEEEEESATKTKAKDIKTHAAAPTAAAEAEVDGADDGEED